jgi:hypothetical protein
VCLRPRHHCVGAAEARAGAGQAVRAGEPSRDLNLVEFACDGAAEHALQLAPIQAVLGCACRPLQPQPGQVDRFLAVACLDRSHLGGVEA